jgi:hypothetical protein
MKLWKHSWFGALALSLVLPMTVHADTFINSDDYKDDDEVIGKFLNDDDYRQMVDDLTRGGGDFDWGWVKGEIKKGKVKSLGFDPSVGISVAKVKNLAGVIDKDLPDHVEDVLEQALDSASIKTSGPLELSAAIVDLKTTSTYIYFANVDPFLELELRLKDKKSGETLMVIRHQAHGDTVDDAAINIANDLAKFLR